MKIGHVEIHPVRQYADRRYGFDDYSSGRRRKVRFISKQKAEARAIELGVLRANWRDDLLNTDRAELARFRAWEAAAKNSKPLNDATREFVALKRAKSSRHIESLTQDLRLFEVFIGATRPISSISAPDIQRFVDSRNVGERRRYNLRAAVVSLFMWARRMSYLPDQTTEAEKTEKPERKPGKPNVLTPDQMRTLLDNVREEFLPWLVISAFAGIRSEEIAPDPKSKKDPLRWEDFDWRHRIIVVREETAKTREEREVPMPANLAEWLAPWRNASGRVCAARQPTRVEIPRLGKLIGSWKHNALRDSFCSYRARITRNVPQVSYEMGNSIAMVKRSYHRRQPIGPAREWFNIKPAKTPKILSFKAA